MPVYVTESCIEVVVQSGFFCLNIETFYVNVDPSVTHMVHCFLLAKSNRTDPKLLLVSCLFTLNISKTLCGNNTPHLNPWANLGKCLVQKGTNKLAKKQATAI